MFRSLDHPEASQTTLTIPAAHLDEILRVFRNEMSVASSDGGQAEVVFHHFPHQLAWIVGALIEIDKDAARIALDAFGPDIKFRKTNPEAMFIRDVLVEGRDISYSAFRDEFDEKLQAMAKSQLVPVENGSTEKGDWVHVTGAEAAGLASHLSETGVSLWISNRFDEYRECAQEEVLPEFYLLVDSAENPSEAYVALAAVPEDRMSEGARVTMIAPHGHATGARNENPYPEYGEAISKLVEIENLHYEPNYMGRKQDYEPEDDGPSM